MTTPNFFQIANSELTQDGFIQWLLEWANPQYAEFDGKLHIAALAFVRLLLLPDNNTEDICVSSVECEAQKNNIDILALIKDDVNQKKYAVIIEDKTDTTVHDNQLVRYSMDVKERYNEWELHCVYFKTGNESNYSLDKIERDYKKNNWVITNKPIFKMVLREDVLKVLGSFSPQNVIYSDFVNNLDRIQRWTKSYKNEGKIVNEWGNTAWQGYYMGLEGLLGRGAWRCGQGDPIINKKGIKVSAWEFALPMLPIMEDDSIQLYLQLGLRKLSIKAQCASSTNPKKSLKNAMAHIKIDMAEYIERTNLKLEEIKNIHTGKDITIFNIKREVEGETKQFIGLNYTYAELSYVVPQLLELYEKLKDISDILKRESIEGV